MKLELVKKTTKIFGREYYFVTADGSMLSETWTSDPVKAEEEFKRIQELSLKFPADVEETLKTVEV